MDDRRIAEAVDALRRAGHAVTAVPGGTHIYRVDGKDPISGSQVLALAIGLGLMDPPPRSG